MASKEALIQDLSDAIYEMEDDGIIDIAEAYLAAGYDPYDAVSQGLVDGMNRAGEAFAAEEYFVTDLLFASDAMYAAMDVLKPALMAQQETRTLGTMVIGNVKGDTHDIGKNLVITMLEVAGFHMVDLGKDVDVETFITAAEENEADIIGISTLMTTTMPNMRAVLDELRARGLRDKYKVMVGGGPVNERFAEEIGADAYSEDAMEAVVVAKRLLGLDDEA